MTTLVLPIYYTQKFKTKSDKVWLVGDNAYRNWHYFFKNEVKQHYHTLVGKQACALKIPGQFVLQIDIYLKNPTSDPSNVASRMEKFTLDGLQECGTIIDDTSKYHIGTNWEFKAIDKDDPRVEITLNPIK